MNKSKPILVVKFPQNSIDSIKKLSEDFKKNNEEALKGYLCLFTTGNVEIEVLNGEYSSQHKEIIEIQK